MMDEERALRIIDEQLDAALAGMSAPPNFASAVLSRTRQRRPGLLPELLDLIGFVALLAIALLLLLRFAALIETLWWAAALGGAVLVAALYYGLTSARDVGEL